MQKVTLRFKKLDKRAITLTAASETKEYDGEALENSSVIISKGSLVEGHRIETLVVGSITEAGETANKIEAVHIYDAYGRDVTDNYEIECVEGTLTVIESEDE